jgi:hypothetical protein
MLLYQNTNLMRFSWGSKVGWVQGTYAGLSSLMFFSESFSGENGGIGPEALPTPTSVPFLLSILKSPSNLHRTDLSRTQQALEVCNRIKPTYPSRRHRKWRPRPRLS